MTPTSFFDYKKIIAWPCIFTAVFVFLHLAVKLISARVFKISSPEFWPLREFMLRFPGVNSFLLAAVLIFFFYLFVRYFSRSGYKFPQVISCALVLVLGTNLLQGWYDGFLMPITGYGVQYYQDAVKIRNPADFLRYFEVLQLHMQMHSRTHPPGAVLSIYLLNRIFGDPGLISVAIALISVSLSAFFLYGITRGIFGDKNLCGFFVFLFLLLPGVQIYYAACVDALAASFSLGVLYFFLKPRTITSIVGTVIFLFLSSLLTFLFVFLLPVLFGYELLVKRSAFNFFLSLGGLILTYFLLYIVIGFNYFQSLLIALVTENFIAPKLFYGSYNYLFSRLEGIFEIILFLGPFLAVFMLKGLRLLKKNNRDIFKLTWLALGTILSIFIFGCCFHNGETARICLFLYPYLLFPVFAFLKNIQLFKRDMAVLLTLVFGQSLIMQLFGNYSW